MVQYENASPSFTDVSVPAAFDAAANVTIPAKTLGPVTIAMEDSTVLVRARPLTVGGAATGITNHVEGAGSIELVPPGVRVTKVLTFDLECTGGALDAVLTVWTLD